MSADALADGPDFETPLAGEELTEACAHAAVHIVKAVRECDAPAAAKLKALSRIADVADFHRAKLKLEVES